MKNLKAKKKSGVGKAIATLALSAVLLAGGCAVGYGAGTHWTYKKNGTQATVPDNGGSEISTEQNSVLLTEGEKDGANFSVRALKASEYRENDIDAQSVESAYTATVTLANHAEATDKSISLTAEFADGQSASEYISFSSATVQSGEQFTISCLKEFGQPITIKATANGVQEGTKPSCSIKADYVKRFKAVYMTGGEIFREGDTFGNEYGCPYFEDLRLGTDDGNGEMIVVGQDCPASIYLATNVNSTTDMSAGTITEGIKDVKISCTITSQSADSIQWDMTQVETNELDTNPSSNSSNLFYYYGSDSDYMASLGQIIEFAKSEAGNYTQALNKYNRNEASLIIAVQFTGKITGITYTFWSNVVINPAGLYTAAQSPAFDGNTSGGIVF